MKELDKGTTHIPKCTVNKVMCKKRTKNEFKFGAQIGPYDMDNIILDLGILFILIWFPIQLLFPNQYNFNFFFFFSIGRLSNVEVDIDGVTCMVDFEVIKIVDDIDS